MTIGLALIIIGSLIGFMAIVLWVSRRLWPDMYDDYETLEWDDDVTTQLGERKGDERHPD